MRIICVAVAAAALAAKREDLATVTPKLQKFCQELFDTPMANCDGSAVLISTSNRRHERFSTRKDDCSAR